jgi:hypothetical protein
MLAVILLLTAFSASDYFSAKQKLSLIEEEKMRPGSVLVFSPAEVNAYAHYRAQLNGVEGVRDPRFQIQTGRVRASALIDFVKLQETKGEPPGWVMRQLLSGERPVTVDLRVTSNGGRCRVDVERVEVSGVPVEGRGLEFLIDHFFRPRFPEAKIGEWFELHYRLEAIELSPRGVLVRAKG